MQTESVTSLVQSDPVRYGSFEEYVADLQRVFSGDYHTELTKEEAGIVAKQFDALLISLI